MPWTLAALLALLYLFIFLTYTTSTNSAFEPSLLPFGQMPSMLLATFIAIGNVIPAVSIGAYVGGRDYAQRTAGSAVVWSGRCRMVLGKVLATTIAMITFVIASALFGIAVGVTRDSTVANLQLDKLFQQVLLTSLASIMLALAALAVATATRSTGLANLLLLLLLFGQMFAPPDVAQALRFVNPLTVLGGFAQPAFSNLAGLKNVAITFASDLSAAQATLGTALYLGVCLAVTAGIVRYREFR